MQKATRDVLENFAGINQGILIRQGNEIRTISVMRDIYARAVVPDSFGVEFAIYDLNEFLATLSLFEAPELDYGKEALIIKSGKTQVRYNYSKPSVIVSPPADKDIKADSGDMEFRMSANTLKEILKAASVMKLKHVEFSADSVRVFNRNNVGNQYTTQLENPKVVNPVTVVLKIENLKMLPDDYDVIVTEKFVQFTGVNMEIRYAIGVESE